MANTTVDPSVKKYYDYAQQQVDEQAILDKFNAATTAQYNIQREQNRQAENQFYNQMYNSQQTAVDAIRQANAAAVSTGASRGIQAANELSAILGLQQESVASATELAQANRQTAQEETAAVLENVLNAYQQAEQQRQNIVTAGIQAASVDATNAQTQATKEATQSQLVTEATQNGTDTYLTALQQSGIDYSNGVVTPESQNSLNLALNNIGAIDGKPLTFNADDWADNKTGAAKADTIVATLQTIGTQYGIDMSKYQAQIDALKTLASNTKVSWLSANADNAAVATLGLTEPNWGAQWKMKTAYANLVQEGYNKILTNIRNDYNAGNKPKS